MFTLIFKKSTAEVMHESGGKVLKVFQVVLLLLMISQ